MRWLAGYSISELANAAVLVSSVS